jgi:hypothetical protein
MDSSMHVEKALGRTSRLEPLHFTLSPSHGLMALLLRDRFACHFVGVKPN